MSYLHANGHFTTLAQRRWGCIDLPRINLTSGKRRSSLVNRLELNHYITDGSIDSTSEAFYSSFS